MPSVLALIPRTTLHEAFDRPPAVGDLMPIDRFKAAAALAGLEEGGTLYLVGTRSDPERLWLVAVLRSPRYSAEDGAWVGLPNSVRVIDITSTVQAFRFTSGAGVEPLVARNSVVPLEELFGEPRALAPEDELMLQNAINLAQGITLAQLEAPGSRPRPSGLDARARWSPEENCWVLGEHDVQGRRQGAFHAYAADGSPMSIYHYVDGQGHGPYRAFHANGELDQDGFMRHGQYHGRLTCHRSTAEVRSGTFAGAPDSLWRIEMEFDGKDVLFRQAFDREGREVSQVTGELAPARPPGLPPQAWYQPNSLGDDTIWVLGPYHGGTGFRFGTWRGWTEAGVPALEIDYVDGNVRAKRHQYPTGRLRREVRFDDRKSLVFERVYHPETGQLTKALDVEDGLRQERLYSPGGEGRLLTDKKLRDDMLVAATYFDEVQGHLEWQMAAERQQLHWTEYWPNGKVRSRACTTLQKKWTGTLQFFDETGALLTAFPAKELGLFADVPRSGLHALSQVLPAWNAWLAKPRPPALSGLESLAWHRLPCCYSRNASAIPQYLWGLCAEDPRIVALVHDRLLGQLEHQSSIYPATTAASHVMLRLLESHLGDAEQIVRALLLFASSYDFSQVQWLLPQIRAAFPKKAFRIEAYAQGGAAVTVTHRDVPLYLRDLYSILGEGFALFERWARQANGDLQAACVMLLPLGLGSETQALAALVDIAHNEETPLPSRIDAVLGLSLLPAGPALHDALDDAAWKGSPPALTLASAIARARAPGTMAAGRAGLANFLIQALSSPGDYPGYQAANWANDVASDTSEALGLLGADSPEVLQVMMAALSGTTHPLSALDITGAVLTLAFPQEDDDDWEDDDDDEETSLTPSQRDVLATIVRCEAAWSFDANLSGILRDHDLPGERDALARLARVDSPAEPI